MNRPRRWMSPSRFRSSGCLRELCNRLDMAILFITHDMGVIAQLADRVAVMYAGRIVETAAVDALFGETASSLHPRADGLHAVAKFRRAPRCRPLRASRRRPGTVAAGCVFAPRCAAVRDVCRVATPPRAGGLPKGTRCCALSRWPAGSCHERQCHPRRSGPDRSRSVPGEPAGNTGCRRWMAYRCRWPKARSSGSSASPAAARPRSADPSSGWSSPTAATSISRAPK